MDSLVLCTCGHELSLHDDSGCRGTRSSRCTCPFTRQTALDAAVDAARTRPWTSPETEAAG